MPPSLGWRTKCQGPRLTGWRLVASTPWSILTWRSVLRLHLPSRRRRAHAIPRRQHSTLDLSAALSLPLCSLDLNKSNLRRRARWHHHLHGLLAAYRVGWFVWGWGISTFLYFLLPLRSPFWCFSHRHDMAK